MQRVVKYCVGLVFSVAVTSTQAANDQASTLHGKLHDCASRTNDSDRLACYDALAKDSVAKDQTAKEPMVKVPAAKNAVVKDAAAPAIAAKSTAAEHPARTVETPPKEKSKLAPDPSTITAKVVKVEKRAYGRWTITLDNDEVWVQNESNSGVSLRVGDVVTIEKGVLGSHLLSGPSGGATYVKRLQ